MYESENFRNTDNSFSPTGQHCPGRIYRLEYATIEDLGYVMWRLLHDAHMNSRKLNLLDPSASDCACAHMPTYAHAMIGYDSGVIRV